MSKNSDLSLKFFAGELQGHALRILGTVDFLGNPIGLAADVADGLQDLVLEGSVGTLVSNVGYGLSNSISKVLFSFSLENDTSQYLFNSIDKRTLCACRNFNLSEMRE